MDLSTRGENLWPGEVGHRLAYAAAATSEGIWDWDIPAGRVSFSPQCLKLLGYTSASQVLPSANYMLSIVHPEDRVRVKRARAARLAGRDEMVEVEARIRTRSGNYTWVLDRGKVVSWNSDGQPTRMVGTIADISGRKLTEQAVRVMSTELSRVPGKAIFDQLAVRLAAIVGAEIGFVGTIRPDPVSTVRTLGFSIDGAAVAQIEFSVSGTPSELVVNGQMAVFPSDVQLAFPDDADLAALDAVGYLAAPLVDASGHVLGVIGVVSRSPLVDPEQSASIVSLFALRAAAEVERQRSDDRFATIFESVPDAVIITNQRGQIVQTNGVAERTLGYSREEFAHLSIEDLVPQDERARHARRRAAFLQEPTSRRMGPARPRMWALRKDGQQMPVEISLSPMRLADEDLVVATIRDITARVKMEDEHARFEARFREVQKMQALGTLAGGIAHDFNNLLTVIRGGLELAQLHLDRDHPASEQLALVATASARASELVQQIRTFSGRHAASRQSIALQTVFDEVTHLLRASIPAGMHISAAADRSMPNLLADPSQIHQVMMNLGTNAWQAIERPTGHIELRLDTITVPPDPAGLPGELAPGLWARLTVTDDGCGMDPDTIKRMFEPFFTTKPSGQGTGLGLSVVHGIVADHGGRTTVDSTVGRGTTVTVFLPITDAPQTTHPASPHALPTSGRVLLIDDEHVVGIITAELLAHLGYHVTCLADAREALELITSDSHAFDVVITDQNMPDLCGLDMARTIFDLRPDLPVVLMSGNLTQTDDELAASNVLSFVAKPFTGESLTQAIEQALGGRRDAISI